MPVKFLGYLSRCVAVGLLSLILVGSASAQYEIGQGWSEPVNLSNTPSSSNSPAIAADPYGAVHVFWSEDLDGIPHPEGSAPSAGNSIIYRRFQDGAWNDPTDIFYSDGGRLDTPWAVVSEDGLIHLVWIQGGALYYSFAHVLSSENVKAWAPPIMVEGNKVGQVRILNVSGRVVVIYSVVAGESSGLYSISLDGEAEALPNLIWLGSLSGVPQDLGAAVDGRGRIHAVWSVAQPPSPAGVAVQYAISEDEGYSWSDSLLVASSTSPEDSLAHASPWVAAHGEEEIHIQWAQGVHTYRWHQLSLDGGRTWSRPYQIWTDLISQTRSEAVGLDGDGNLYWLDVLRFPNAGYLIRWTGREWQRPELFLGIVSQLSDVLDYRINIHAIRVAISRGNQMHVVFKDQDRGEIWYMHRELTARGIADLSAPTAVPMQTPTPIPLLVSPPGAQEIQQQAAAIADLEMDINLIVESPADSVMVGVVPILLILAVLAVKKVKRGL
jgi:hypothetical protein